MSQTLTGSFAAYAGCANAKAVAAAATPSATMPAILARDMRVLPLGDIRIALPSPTGCLIGNTLNRLMSMYVCPCHTHPA
ncbi:hypothetical protein Afe04nite_59890 [Asanoa ferruginea]|nr:hypothetical protein Afe04nite_59890 [Asanoa ferruginea]